MVKIILVDKILDIEYRKIRYNPYFADYIEFIQSEDKVYIDCNYDDFVIFSCECEKIEKIEKIFDLIIKENTQIYFDNEKQ
jgi:hypothetical protein